MLLTRRRATIALGALATTFTFAHEAKATTALRLTMQEIVARSERVVVGTPVEHSSHWAKVGGGKRIVTWTRVLQEEDLLGDTSTDEILVMTLGGKVGSIRQKVSGEAALVKGEKCLLFVSREEALARRVVGMAQGYFELGGDDGDLVLRKSRHLPHLLGDRPTSGPERTRAVVDLLDGLPLTRARQLVRGAR